MSLSVEGLKVYPENLSWVDDNTFDTYHGTKKVVAGESKWTKLGFEEDKIWRVTEATKQPLVVQMASIRPRIYILSGRIKLYSTTGTWVDTKSLKKGYSIESLLKYINP